MAVENVTIVCFLGIIVGQFIFRGWSLLIANIISMGASMGLMAYAPDEATRTIGFIFFFAFLIKTILDVWPSGKKNR